MKIASFILLLILSVVTVFSQHISNKNVGILAGPNRSLLSGSFDLPYTLPSTHFTGGLSAETEFSKHFSLCANLLYERIGNIGKANYVCFNKDNDDHYGDFSAHVNFDYIIMPVMLKMQTRNKLRFFCELGPNISYLLTQYTFYDWVNFKDGVVNDYDSYKKINIGFTAGLGFSLPLSYDTQVSIECRNNHGLYDINNLNSLNKSIRTNSYNALLGLTYLLNQGKPFEAIQHW